MACNFSIAFLFKCVCDVTFHICMHFWFWGFLSFCVYKALCAWTLGFAVRSVCPFQNLIFYSFYFHIKPSTQSDLVTNSLIDNGWQFWTLLPSVGRGFHHQTFWLFSLHTHYRVFLKVKLWIKEFWKLNVPFFLFAQYYSFNMSLSGFL